MLEKNKYKLVNYDINLLSVNNNRANVLLLKSLSVCMLYTISNIIINKIWRKRMKVIITKVIGQNFAAIVEVNDVFYVVTCKHEDCLKLNVMNLEQLKRSSKHEIESIYRDKTLALNEFEFYAR